MTDETAANRGDQTTSKDMNAEPGAQTGHSATLNATQDASASMSSLRALMPFLLRYPYRLFFTVLFLLVAASTQLVIPLFARGMIDDGFIAQNLENVAQYGWGIMAVSIVAALAGGARFYFISQIGERTLTDLRSAVFERLMYLDSTFYDANRVGELTSRLNGDVATVRSAVGSTATLALRSLVIMIGAVIMMFLTNAMLALAVVIGVPLLLAPILMFARRLRKMSRLTQDRLADLSAMATEVLSSTKTVKAFTQESAQTDLYAERSEVSYHAEVKRLKVRAVMIGMVTLAISGSIVFLLWFGAYNIFQGNVTAGELTQFLIYAILASSNLLNMSELFGTLQQLAGATERLVELLNTEPDLPLVTNPVAMPNPSPATVSFDSVDFSYSTRSGEAVLDDVSFTVEKGQTVAFVGPSGSGKSTVFSLILRFYDAVSGSVRVDGVDVKKADPQELRSRISYVEQESTIFAGTVAENVRFGRPEATDEEVRAAAKAALVNEFVEGLPDGYDTLVGERGLMLSGGQKQRIAIARALLKDAPILLLDEATSALDAQSEHLVQAALEELMKGRTTLVIAHRLATIRDADHILVLENGKLIGEGTHDNLITEGGRYAELAKLQFDLTQNGQSENDLSKELAS